MTNKVIRDGKVAVLYSPGYGAGWSTWADDSDPWTVFSPEVVAWVESGKKGNIEEIVKQHFGDSHFYCGGARDLQIEWIPEGIQFRITEYDGSESIEFNYNTDWYVA